MIRNARESDIPRLVEIRAAVRENQLRDASRVTFANYQWFIANPGMFVWEEGDRIVGFSAEPWWRVASVFNPASKESPSLHVSVQIAFRLL